MPRIRDRRLGQLSTPGPRRPRHLVPARAPGPARAVVADIEQLRAVERSSAMTLAAAAVDGERHVSAPPYHVRLHTFLHEDAAEVNRPAPGPIDHAGAGRDIYVAARPGGPWQHRLVPCLTASHHPARPGRDGVLWLPRARSLRGKGLRRAAVPQPRRRRKLDPCRGRGRLFQLT